ncbi:Maf family protein [Nakamurella deserti]|uniref:Maf family protein n=1 Tax=Nakamurella deserti TaxID=2164074 RepID=UPI000DBE2E98|nr:Maf family protein [Nakamurella deserti]
MTTFILASASPARRAVLTAAGIDPEVRVANLNEDKLIAGMAGSEPEKIVTELAVAKARAVIRTLDPALTTDSVVVACDSMLRMGKSLLGKPLTVDRARLYWDQMSGRTGTLLTGHAAVRIVDGTTVATADGCESTQIRFGRPTEPELEAYLASGEPLQVAGACTIDGLGGWFIDGVDGDPSSVIGISLPLTRRLLDRVGLRVTDLWRPPDPA